MTAPRRLPGLLVTERVHSLPLDHSRPDAERIEVFTREVADPEGADKPMLLYLEGGPGFEAPRPSRLTRQPSWLERALRDFRVLLMDQRGTGRSTPVGADLSGDPAAQAERLACLRADSIVADAELIRRELGVERWSVLGQSFGGFCAVAYLSRAPDGLREVLLTGGLPALGPAIDDVYRATYERMAERTRRLYARYPEDRERVRSLYARLADEPVRLPDGDLLHGPRLRALGHALGRTDGADTLHYILELDPDSSAFGHDAQHMSPFGRNPIYAILHEACWADGGRTGWAAERMLAERPEAPEDLLTGEHVFPWMFREIAALAPLREAAELLADREWPRLYDPDQLAANEVPVAAAIYAEDVYVERRFSEETAAAIKGLRPWLTNEYEHEGLRADADRVLGRLLDMARGRV